MYADGARMLHAMGHPAAVTCALRRYVAANAYGIATQADLARALTAGVPGARRVLAALRRPARITATSDRVRGCYRPSARTETVRSRLRVTAVRRHRPARQSTPLRTLAVDAVEQAKSGHPGLPMGAAPMAHVLWTRYLRHNPADPAWPGRDRFVLSAGHGCMLLYALLHLTGYDLPLDELKRFRQWGSLTPGPSRARPHAGRRGDHRARSARARGTRSAWRSPAKHLAARFGDAAGFRVFALVSDGDLMEGVSGEASSLAGHLALDNLVFLYDDNHVTIDGDTELAFTEDRAARYAAYGWHTLTVDDGNDLDAIDAAIAEGIAHEGQPTFISVKTIIGYGSVDAGTSRAHSDARGPEQQAETKRALGFDPEKFFFIPDAVPGALPGGARPRRGAGGASGEQAVGPLPEPRPSR